MINIVHIITYNYIKIYIKKGDIYIIYVPHITITIYSKKARLTYFISIMASCSLSLIKVAQYYLKQILFSFLHKS